MTNARLMTFRTRRLGVFKDLRDDRARHGTTITASLLVLYIKNVVGRMRCSMAPDTSFRF